MKEEILPLVKPGSQAYKNYKEGQAASNKIYKETALLIRREACWRDLDVGKLRVTKGKSWKCASKHRMGEVGQRHQTVGLLARLLLSRKWRRQTLRLMP